MNVSSEIALAAPIERVWELLVRWEDQARWMRDACSVRLLTEQHEGVGTRIGVKTRVLNVPLFTERLEVTIWEAPRRLVIAHRSLVRGVVVWRLQPFEGGTWFSWTEELALPIPILGELALRVYRPFMRRLMDGALANLQAWVASAT